MNAYLLTEPGNIEQLQLTQVAKPSPNANEVLVRTRAISINPVDAKTRAGKGVYGRFKDHLPLILGWDIAGTVESVGSSVTKFKAGDDVFGLINFPGIGNAYAEFVAVPTDQIALKPANISFEEAAAATLAPLTAFQILSPNVKRGDKVILQSAAGGVGHFAVQIAKILGAEVTAITSTRNIDFVKSLGADRIIDYTKSSYEDARGFDFALDTLSGESLRKLAKTVADGGMIYTLPSGANNEELSAALKNRNVSLGFHMVNSSGEDMEQLARWLESGQLRAEVSQIFDFSEMREAHKSIESGRTKGKIVVKV